MGLFGKVFGKEEKKSCCDVRIVEVPEGDEAPDACDCEGACDADRRCRHAHDPGPRLQALPPAQQQRAGAGGEVREGAERGILHRSCRHRRGGHHGHACASREREGRLAGQGAHGIRDRGAAVSADGGSERSADEQEEIKAERHFVCRISQGFGCSKQNCPPWPVSDRHCRGCDIARRCSAVGSQRAGRAQR